MLRRLTVLLLGSAGILAGCGGGGADGTEPSYATLEAWRQLLQAPRNWTVSGVGNDGQTWAFVSAYTNAGAGTFPVTGDPAGRSVQRTDVRANGTSQGEATATLYYDASLLVLGNVQNDSGQCGIAINAALPPDRAAVGASGSLGSIRTLVDCTSTRVWNGLLEMGWSVETEGSDVLFCVNTRVFDASRTTELGRQAECYDMSVGGDVGGRVRLTLAVPSIGFSVVARNY